MDYQRFSTQLPDRYIDWAQATVCPKDDRFTRLLAQVNSPIGAGTMQLLNLAIDCLEADEVYCEVGCGTGASLIGALLDHPDCKAYAVDAFAGLDGEAALVQLAGNLETCGMDEQVWFCCQSAVEFFQEMATLEAIDRIGVFFYNAAVDDETLRLTLLLVRPFLAERSLLVIAPADHPTVHRVSDDILAAQPEWEWLVDLSAPTFGGGIRVFRWDGRRESAPNRNPEFYRRSMLAADPESRSSLVHQLQVEATAAISRYNAAWLAEARSIPTLLAWVREPLREAVTCYQEATLWEPLNPTLWSNLGNLYRELEQPEPALAAFGRSLQLRPDQAALYYQQGHLWEQQGAIDQARQAYQIALQVDASWVQAHEGVGRLALQQADLAPAEAAFLQVVQVRPDYFGGHWGLGQVREAQGRVADAIVHYQAALALAESQPDVLTSLGRVLQAAGQPQADLYQAKAALVQNDFQTAIDHYQQFLQCPTADRIAEVYIGLADAYRCLGQERQAAEVCQQGLQHYPNHEVLHIYRVTSLQNAGFTQAAIDAAQESAQQFPHNPSWQFEQWRTFPLLYETTAEIDAYRSRFTHGLQNLLQHTRLDSPEARWQAMLGIWWRTNFYLYYQCRNDRHLLTQYGEYMHRVMTAIYPQWADPLAMPGMGQNGKIRVGYVSSFFRDHVVARMMLGWLQNCDRTQFEVYTYYTGVPVERLTRQFRQSSDQFHHIPEDLEAVCQQLRSDDLHILVFTDIGMEPLMSQLASLHLAPVQCAAWGHPVTTGIPTVRYFLTSDAMEPDNAEDHYSETLVRLPGTGLCYARPQVPPPVYRRQDFDLREEATVYLCSQSLFKYLPQYDYLLPAIARQVPHAQFAFLGLRDVNIVEKFRQRLHQAFAGAGLDSREFCMIVPRQKQLGYWGLNQVADILLDSLGWSGGNTVFDAIACQLPVVTCPGELMRGRHAAGILRSMGMTRTIAQTEAEYIAIAVRLGLDLNYRAQVRQEQTAFSPAAFHDLRCVQALEDFYRQVVQSSLH